MSDQTRLRTELDAAKTAFRMAADKADWYAVLLAKYIRYLNDVEGANYIDYDPHYASDVKFTDEEWAELRRLAAQK